MLKKSAKDFMVRVIKKGKKRGRPSKPEITLSKILSWHMNKPEVKESVNKSILDQVLYGKGAIEIEYRVKQKETL